MVSTGSLAVTTGIVELLDEQELRAVLAHELFHIQNRDILISTIAATLAATLGLLARTMLWEGRGTKIVGGTPIFVDCCCYYATGSLISSVGYISISRVLS